jgi:hypothetical protein
VDKMRRRLLSRRQVIATGVAVIALRCSQVAARPLDRLPRRIYLLDPLLTATGGCAGCDACRRHAAHKRFLRPEAADANRAHPYCRCGIRAVWTSSAEIDRLFPREPDGRRRQHADLRWPLLMGPAMPGGGLEKPVAGVR